MTSIRALPLRVLAIFLLGALAAGTSHAAVRFHWESGFSAADKQKLTKWVMETHSALESLVGELPFETHIYLHRRNSREPVPWAHTQRSGRQGVHFHVDPSFSLEEFRQDWTAPHELSHLVLPYVSRKNSWFAEGFASYMQYQVMREMGVLSERAMTKRYLRNLQRAERGYAHRNRPFAKAAPRLRSEGKYPTMYWGGAAYFLQVNDALMTSSDTSLVDALKRYIDCCRSNRNDLDRLVRQLDRLTSSTIFSEHLEQFRSTPGFPAYRPMVPNATR